MKPWYAQRRAGPVLGMPSAADRYRKTRSPMKRTSAKRCRRAVSLEATNLNQSRPSEAPSEAPRARRTMVRHDAEARRTPRTHHRTRRKRRLVGFADAYAACGTGVAVRWPAVVERLLMLLLLVTAVNSSSEP